MLNLVWTRGALSSNLCQVVAYLVERVGAAVGYQEDSGRCIISIQDLSSPIPRRILDELYELLPLLRFCLRHDPMSRVEDGSRLGCDSTENVGDLFHVQFSRSQ